MDIVTKLEDAYAFLGDPLHREAADEIERLRRQVEFERASLRSAFDELLERDNEIERLQGQVEKLEEEVYLLSSDLAHIYVKIGDKTDENS